MPKVPVKPAVTEEEDSGVIDETTQETEETTQEADETASQTDDTSTEETEGAEGETTEEASSEEESAEPEPSAREVELQAKLKAAEDENALLKGQTEPPAPKTDQRRSYIQGFVQTHLPSFKRTFITQGSTPEQQFDAMFQAVNHLVGAVLADQVTPFQEHLAQRLIQSENEWALRDLRDDPKQGSIFKSVEPKVREALKAMPWPERVKPDAIRHLYHRFLGERNGTLPTVANGKGPSSNASAALRDVSAGTHVTTGKPPQAFKLTPEQERDFQAMLEEGETLSREKYYARYKARAAKAKAESRTIPKTLRSFR